MESRLRTHLSSHVGQGMAALLLAQPLLDVLSYFMQEAGSTAFTTALRMAMLAEKKRPYYVLGGVLLGFWLLHMANCFRLGYQDPVGDAAEFLKLAQFPLWTLAFSTFLRQRDGLDTLSAWPGTSPSSWGSSPCPTPWACPSTPTTTPTGASSWG